MCFCKTYYFIFLRLSLCLSFFAPLFSSLTLPLCILFLLLFLNSLSSSALKEFSSIFLLSLCLKLRVQTLEKLKPKFEYNPGFRTSISLSLCLSPRFSPSCCLANDGWSFYISYLGFVIMGQVIFIPSLIRIVDEDPWLLATKGDRIPLQTS